MVGAARLISHSVVAMVRAAQLVLIAVLRGAALRKQQAPVRPDIPLIVAMGYAVHLISQSVVETGRAAQLVLTAVLRGVV